MNIINRRLHGILDYVVGIVLVLSPRLFRFHDGGIEQSVPVFLGWAAIIYSLLTNYELGVLKLIPFRVHLGLDLLSGIFLAASPWLLGFADRVWVPHVILGCVEIAAVVLTRREPTPSAGAGAPTTRVHT
jgi:hypothetical protein